MMNKDKEDFIALVQNIVRTEINNLGLLQGQWHLGVVDTIVDAKFLNTFIDGSIVSQKIPFNPSVTFAIGDNILILYVNGNSRDKYAFAKRTV